MKLKVRELATFLYLFCKWLTKGLEKRDFGALKVELGKVLERADKIRSDMQTEVTKIHGGVKFFIG
jgi:hypothetical protein